MSDADGQGRGGLVWEREEPPPRAPLAPLRRAALVRAAVALADEGGMEAVSVRALGAALGVGPMRLYRVVRSTGELAELMVDEVYAEAAPTATDSEHWRDRVRALAAGLRAAALRHEWAADLLGGRPHLGPHGLAFLEAMAAALSGAPTTSSPTEVWTALHAVNGYLIGTIRREVADRRSQSDGEGHGAWQARLAPYVHQMLDTGRFPTLRGLIGTSAQPEGDDAFARGLDLLLDGITAGNNGGHDR